MASEETMVKYGLQRKAHIVSSDVTIARPATDEAIEKFDRAKIAPVAIPTAKLPFAGFEVKEKTAPVTDPAVLARYKAAQLLQDRFAPKSAKAKAETESGQATIYWKERGSIAWLTLDSNQAFTKARSLSKCGQVQVEVRGTFYNAQGIAIPLAEVWKLPGNASGELDETNGILLIAQYDEGYTIQAYIKRESDTPKGILRQKDILDAKCRSLCLDGARAIFLKGECIYTKDQALRSMPAPSIDPVMKSRHKPVMHVNRPSVASKPGKWMKVEQDRCHFSRG